MAATLPTTSTPPGTAAEVSHRRTPALLVGGPARPYLREVALVFLSAILAKTAILVAVAFSIIAVRGGR